MSRFAHEHGDWKGAEQLPGIERAFAGAPCLAGQRVSPGALGGYCDGCAIEGRRRPTAWSDEVAHEPWHDNQQLRCGIRAHEAKHVCCHRAVCDGGLVVAAQEELAALRSQSEELADEPELRA